MLNRTIGKLSLTAVILSFILMSCASTELISTWKDDSYSGSIKNVLVIVITEKKAVRRVLERVYAMQFKGYGVNAVPSHEILPDEKMLNKDTILSKIEDMGIDSVLLTRLVSREEVTTEYYGHGTHNRYGRYGGWYGYYSDSYRRSYTDDIVNLETVLYEVKNEKAVWSVLSETTILEGTSSFKEMQPFVETILKNLSKDKLIQ